MISAANDSSVVQEYECWQCWNRYRVKLAPSGQSEAGVFAKVVIEHPCPYCGRPNEFSRPVLGVELIEMSEARRRLGVLRRRLGLAGSDLLVRVRELRREVIRRTKGIDSVAPSRKSGGQ
jgi:hypothetical protein